MENSSKNSCPRVEQWCVTGALASEAVCSNPFVYYELECRAVGWAGEHQRGASVTLGINKWQLCSGPCSSCSSRGAVAGKRSTCPVAQLCAANAASGGGELSPRSFLINWFRIWSRSKQIYFMKTKTELYKDWEENDSLKTGKVLCKILCTGL